MRPENARAVPAFTLKEENQGCHPVQCHAQRKFVEQLARIEVLINHGESVSKVQVGLSGALIAQCTRSQVVNVAFSAIEDLASAAVELPAQVDLLHMRKQIFIETALCMKCG